jgi:hypothetical protein
VSGVRAAGDLGLRILDLGKQRIQEEEREGILEGWKNGMVAQRSKQRAKEAHSNGAGHFKAISARKRYYLLFS